MVLDARSATERLDWFCNVSPPNSARFAVTVLAAHPDDEIIGAGVRLSKLSRVTILLMTNGAPRNMQDARAAGFATAEQYAKTRYTETLAALSVCGISPLQVVGLQVPDQESVRQLAWLSRSVAFALEHLASDIMVTHPYEGGHPDHDAAAFCAHAASTLLHAAHLRLPNAIIEFTSYHARDDQIQTGQFRPNGGAVTTLHLSSREQYLKRKMLACHATQRHVLAQFSVSTESFRLAPIYDFMRPPDPPIYYDRFDWGLRSTDWGALASDAICELNLNGSPRPPHEHLR
ncbi:MAG: PIG-L family deacetylase [Deltaproteobacteria bacterium]|nr:PIG-L family deacetylase [Deltaproteobacteria bacterium]